MFTGIIEELGTIAGIEDQGDAIRLTIAATTVLEDAVLGASIAVNGCCLTIAILGEGEWTADVMQETLKRTGLDGVKPGDRVNLERSVTPQTRLGGHIVQGHVDGVGQIVTRAPSEHWDIVTISLPEDLARYVVEKGSIAVDGISLTVVDVTDDTFTVSLIPETLARTTLGTRQPGDAVNLETDIIAKHVERLLSADSARLDVEKGSSRRILTQNDVESARYNEPTRHPEPSRRADSAGQSVKTSRLGGGER